MDYQLDLFSEDRLPHRPYCTDWLENGLVIRGVNQAMTKRYIQANPHSMLYRLVFDIDRPDAALDWMGRGVAAPSWVAENPTNEHAHLGYEIAVPICTTENARTKPLHYAAAIERAFSERLDADVHYSGLIVKNPLHPDWRLYTFAEEAYSLRDLAKHVDLNTKKRLSKNVEATGLGRNCMMFEELRHWAYRNVDEYRNNGQALYDTWMKAVYDFAVSINLQFSTGLPQPEVKATAKSVGKWTWQFFRGTSEHSPAFLKKQAHRGSLKGKAKRDELLPKALRMIGSGMSQKEIAETLGITDRTLRNWMKNQ